MKPYLRFLLPLLCTACAAQPADIEELLRPEPEGSPVLDLSLEAKLARFDERARLGIEAAEAAPTSATLALEGSRALFQAADLRMLAATFETLEARPSTTVEDWIAADEALSGTIRSEVLALVQTGGALAERALELSEDLPGTELYAAMHLSLEAWAVGSTAALTRGLGRRVPRAIRASIESGASLESAAPLRLLGRFLDRAPWPLRDREEARLLLERAVEEAPVVLNLLFLGDVLWGLDEGEAARRRWEESLVAPSDWNTAEVSELNRDLARRRLSAAN
ncbi:MAG: hypothetical protein ACI8QS_002045 [Planctomycetota bacterium]|jgi:hypothetical protein